MTKRKDKKNYSYKDVYFNKANIVLFTIALFLVCSFSIGYSILEQRLDINANVLVQKEKSIRFTNMRDFKYNNSGYDIYNPTFTDHILSFDIDLPNLNSSVLYTVTLYNGCDTAMELTKIIKDTYSNELIDYTIDTLSVKDVVNVNETKTFVIKFFYKSDVIAVPEITSLEADLNFEFKEHVAVAYDYVQEGVLINLRGVDGPINNTWVDDSNSKVMTLNNVNYDSTSKSYDFTTGGYATYGAPLIPEYGDFTLEAFVKLPSTFTNTDDAAIVAQVDDSKNDNGRFKLNYRYKTKYLLQTFVNNTIVGANEEYVFATGVKTEETYLMQLVRHGEYLSYYLNGALVSTSNFSSDAKISQGSFKLARWNSTGAQSFLGHIYGVRVYDRELTTSELTNNRKIDNYLYFGISPESNIKSYCLETQIITSGNGLYNYNGRYIYKGIASNNYLKFKDDDDVYRIIAFEKDNTMKIINVTDKYNTAYDASGHRDPTTSPYCTNSSLVADATTGDYYGCNAWSVDPHILGNTDNTDAVSQNSTILEYLNGTYYDSLSSDLKAKIISHNFNAGLVNQSIMKSKVAEEAEAKKWQGNIGLVGVEDLIQAGINCATLSANNSTCSNFLTAYTSDVIGMWTINGAKVNTWDVWTSVSGSVIGKRRASRLNQANGSKTFVFYAFPTFYIKSDYKFTGTGVEFDPFIIE